LVASDGGVPLFMQVLDGNSAVSKMELIYVN
jgi:hypothetical protein